MRKSSDRKITEKDGKRDTNMVKKPLVMLEDDREIKSRRRRRGPERIPAEKLQGKRKVTTKKTPKTNDNPIFSRSERDRQKRRLA